MAVFGGDDSDSDDGPVTEGRVFSDALLVEVEIAEDNDEETEESSMGTEIVSEVATELKGVDVGEDCTALLVEGPVPLGTI